MKEETIRMLADKKGMSNVDLFVRFFMRRFPKEHDQIHSWIDRFMSGNPIRYMDSHSKRIYIEEKDRLRYAKFERVVKNDRKK